MPLFWGDGRLLRKPFSCRPDTCSKQKLPRPRDRGEGRSGRHTRAVGRGSVRSIEIFRALTAEHLDEVRALMRGLVEWHRGRHAEDGALIDRYFDAAAFEAELADLPGKYRPP